MPPKKKTLTTSKEDQCCICCQPIVKGKDEGLFCAGACQQWLHRYCAGMSSQCYRAATVGGLPFFCYSCCLTRHKTEIDSLKDTVELLKGEIMAIKTSLPPQHSSQVASDSAIASSSVTTEATEATTHPALKQEKAALPNGVAANLPDICTMAMRRNTTWWSMVSRSVLKELQRCLDCEQTWKRRFPFFQVSTAQLALSLSGTFTALAVTQPRAKNQGHFS